MPPNRLDHPSHNPHPLIARQAIHRLILIHRRSSVWRWSKAERLRTLLANRRYPRSCLPPCVLQRMSLTERLLRRLTEWKADRRLPPNLPPSMIKQSMSVLKSPTLVLNHPLIDCWTRSCRALPVKPCTSTALSSWRGKQPGRSWKSQIQQINTLPLLPITTPAITRTGQEVQAAQML